MKMVKSLLLGSAAGCVAVAGGQAADLPVKAKPIEYVKVCSLYGAGFFYIPGTDTCIKIGGSMRVQASFNGVDDGAASGFGSAVAQGVFTRSGTNDINFRTLIYFTVDTREQTDYGTLRTYWRMGVGENTPKQSITGGPWWDRAFIQLAGFTVGRIVSFYDAVTFHNFTYTKALTYGDTGSKGVTVWAYTAQLGNGISATLSAEDPSARGKLVVNSGVAALGLATGVVNSNGLASNAGGNGFGFPDVVGNLRVDQAWGSAQVMAAMHDASGSYYDQNNIGLGHPDNAYGWAVGTGFVINLPTFGPTGDVNSQPNVDQIQASFSYTRGASGYASNANDTETVFNGNNKLGAGWLIDGVYGTTKAGAQQVDLTTAWGSFGAYQHIWTPQWRTSLYGGYLNVSYDQNATTMLCASGGATFHFNNPCLTGMFDFSLWQVGTRTQWNPVSQLDVGVDVLYTKLNTADAGNTLTTTAPIGGHPNGTYTLSDENVVTVMFRVQRNFWP